MLRQQYGYQEHYTAHASDQSHVIVYNHRTGRLVGTEPDFTSELVAKYGLHCDMNTEQLQLVAAENYELYKNAQLYRAQQALNKRPAMCLLGCRGAGKATQAQLIAAQYGVVVVDPATLIQDELQKAEPSEYTSALQKYVSKDNIPTTYTAWYNCAAGTASPYHTVPTPLLISLILQRIEQPDIQQHGYLLLNFPQTEQQADALLDAQLTSDIVLMLEVSELELFHRITERRRDPVTGTVYHVNGAKPAEDIVSRLQPLQQDNAKELLHEYEHYTRELVGIRHVFGSSVFRVDGNSAAERVFQEIQACMKEQQRRAEENGA